MTYTRTNESFLKIAFKRDHKTCKRVSIENHNHI